MPSSTSPVGAAANRQPSMMTNSITNFDENRQRSAGRFDKLPTYRDYNSSYEANQPGREDSFASRYHHPNLKNNNKKKKRLNRMDLIRSKSQVKLRKIRASMDEMMSKRDEACEDNADGIGTSLLGERPIEEAIANSNKLFNENGIDVDERFIDVTTARQDVDYRVSGGMASSGGETDKQPSSPNQPGKSSTPPSQKNTHRSSDRSYRKSRSREELAPRASVSSPKRVKVIFYSN